MILPFIMARKSLQLACMLQLKFGFLFRLFGHCLGLRDVCAVGIQYLAQSTLSALVDMISPLNDAPEAGFRYTFAMFDSTMVPAKRNNGCSFG